MYDLSYYIVLSVLTALAVAVCEKLVHSSLLGASKFALGIVFTTVLVLSSYSLIRNLSELDFSFELPEYTEGGELEEITAEAFGEGIGAAIAEKYGLMASDVSVFVGGFVLSDMKAGNIRVVLSRSSASSDTRGIREYVKENFLADGGRCEVVIDFG